MMHRSNIFTPVLQLPYVKYYALLALGYLQFTYFAGLFRHYAVIKIQHLLLIEGCSIYLSFYVELF